jgi:hypothetical protein
MRARVSGSCPGAPGCVSIQRNTQAFCGAMGSPVATTASELRLQARRVRLRGACAPSSFSVRNTLKSAALRIETRATSLKPTAT